MLLPAWSRVENEKPALAVQRERPPVTEGLAPPRKHRDSAVRAHTEQVTAPRLAHVEIARARVAHHAARLEGEGGRGEGDGVDRELGRVDGCGRVERDPYQRARTAPPRHHAGEDPQPVRGIDGEILREPEPPGQHLSAVLFRKREPPGSPERRPAPVLGAGPEDDAQEEQQDRRERQPTTRS
jgi:hypothetical protein